MAGTGVHLVPCYLVIDVPARADLPVGVSRLDPEVVDVTGRLR